MRKFIISLLITAAAVAPAYAKTAMWSQSAYWKVTGNTDGVCTAGASYNGAADSIFLSITTDGRWSMSFASSSAAGMGVGEQRIMVITFSDGSSFTMPGTAIDTQQVIVRDVYTKVMAKFAKSKSVYIQNFMTYPLNGSRDAINSMMECALAMKAYTPASAPASAVIVYEREI